MTSPTDFYTEYVKLISALDETVLSVIRKNLDEAPTDSEKKKWQKQLDDSLDERFRLMKIRDGLKKGQS
jgi:hypothetical protein